MNALLLRNRAGESMREIAEGFGVSTSRVRQLIERAKRIERRDNAKSNE